MLPISVWKSLIDLDISSEIESLREGPWPDHKRARQEEQEEDDDSNSSSDNSSDEDETDLLSSLPRSVPHWVLTAPIIPDRTLFTRKDYTKSYSLKVYDMPKSLRKELKKISKWWTKDRNAERRGAKPIGEGTADKREERILCFMGFVQRYKCLRDSETDHVLTTSLYLNHRLFEAYLDYLKEVRECTDGTIGEAITAAVSTCRWQYRKE